MGLLRGDDVRAEAVLARASSVERTTLAINAYGYCHLLLLLGVIAMAAGIEHALGHPTDQLELGPALALAGGVALFMLGQALFRNTLGIGRSGWCVGATLGALATVPVGTEIGAVHELTALLLVLVLAFKGEHLHSGRTHRHG